MKRTIFVVMAVLAIFAIVSCDNGTTTKVTKYAVTFDADGGQPVPSVQQIEKGKKVAEPTAPAKQGYTFGGWLKADNTLWNFSTDTVTAAITLKAKWTAVDVGPGGGDEDNPLYANKTFVEKVELINGNVAAYYFDLPTGKTFADYDGIEADFIVDQATYEASNTVRGGPRLYGNYPLSYLKFIETTAGNKFWTASIGNGAGEWDNGALILDNGPFAGDWKSLEDLATSLNITITPGAWFTVPYKTSGRSHGSYDADVAPSGTGPFIFGLGLTGNNPATAAIVADVRLKGKTDGTADLIGKPLYMRATDTGDANPAFVSYSSTSGNGVDDIKRTPQKGAGVTLTSTDPYPGKAIVEKVELINGNVAAYIFSIPDAKTWADYDGIEADFLVDEVTFEASNRVRGGPRLYGNYALNYLKYVETTAGNKFWAASIGNGNGELGNGNMIIDNGFIGSGWGSINNQLATAMGNAGLDAPVADAWWTLPYWTDTTKKNGDYGKLVDSQIVVEGGYAPAATAKGPFVFGLGLTGDTTATVAMVADVRLKGKTAGTADVVGKPLYIKATSGGAITPAFVSYSSTSGNGVDNIKRTLIKGYRGPNHLATAQSTVAPANYTVTFDLNPALVYEDEDDDEGTIDNTVAFANNFSGSKVVVNNFGIPADELPTATSDNKTFIGWTDVKTSINKVAMAISGGSTRTIAYNAATTLYAIWMDEAVIVSFNKGSATGTKDDVIIGKPGSLTAAQLGKGELTNGTKTFGGWYTVSTTAATFNPNDYTKLVTTNTVLDDYMITLYAYWYDAPSTTTMTVDGYTISATGGGRIDADGYVLFAESTVNNYLGTGNYDTCFNIAVPASWDPQSNTKLIITYSFKWVIEPPMVGDPPNVGTGGNGLDTGAETTWEDNWTIDAAGIWKKYNDMGNNAAANSGSYFSFKQENDSTLVHDKFESFSKDNDGNYVGVSIQINKGDDNNASNGVPLKKRAGGMFGIKVTAVALALGE